MKPHLINLDYKILVSTLFISATPVWYENSPTCEAYPGNELTACFQNQTPGKLTAYAFMMTNHYTNGHWDRSVTPLDGTRPGNYIGASISKDYLKTKKLTSIEYAIVKGTARAPETVAGCNIEVSADSPTKIILTIVNAPAIHC